MSAPPPVAKWFQDGFHTFLKPFLRRHFHTIAVERESLAALGDLTAGPLIIYGNHPSWWDPLIAHFLNRNCFHQRQFYAPIDAAALAQYQVFRKLGFYGIDLSGNRGAAEFLKTSLSILSAPETSLWVTPEGKFTDSRNYDSPLMPGLAHLCMRMPEDGRVIPMALEYVFWEERLPECFIRFGAPIHGSEDSAADKQTWNPLLESGLRENQRRLAELVIARSPEPFQVVLSGARGAGGFYDSFRRFRSLVSGRQFRAEHGRKFH